jgi:N-ethylmaleimide reductase
MSLFQPQTLGALTLPNRIVMAPLGRARGTPASREPTALVASTFYSGGAAGYVDYPVLQPVAEAVS